MPTSGNTLGARRYYNYTDDTGAEFTVLTDETLGTAAGNTLDDTNPGLPRRFQPRGVYVEAEVEGVKVRKFLVCGTTENTLYSSNASQDVTIDGITFKTTGRKGESASFGSNPAGAAPIP